MRYQVTRRFYGENTTGAKQKVQKRDYSEIVAHVNLPKLADRGCIRENKPLSSDYSPFESFRARF